MSNLRLINETTTTGTVSTLDITDVFSADFDIYKIVINDLDVTANPFIYLKFINSSGSVIASGYDRAALLMYSWTTFGESRATNTDKIILGWANGSDTAENIGVVAYVFNPFSSSSYTFFLDQSMSTYAPSGLATNGFKGIAVAKNTSSATGIQLQPSQGGTFGLEIRTYGLRVDS